MKRLLVLLLFLPLSYWGCGGDNGVTSQNQTATINQEQIAPPASTPSETNETPTTESARSPICYANNFVGQTFHVVSYKNKVITADIAVVNCTLQNPRLKGEVRRPHTRGILEFVGDARQIHGTEITIFTGTLPRACRPKKGETLKMIWKARRRTP